MSEVRDRSRKDPMPEGRWPRGVPHVQGQGQWLRVLGCDGAGMAEKSYPSPRSWAAAKRSYPTSEVKGSGQVELPHIRGQGRWPRGATPRSHTRGRGGGREDQLHVQGAVDAWAQEGLEELSNVEGQEGRW